MKKRLGVIITLFLIMSMGIGMAKANGNANLDKDFNEKDEGIPKKDFSVPNEAHGFSESVRNSEETDNIKYEGIGWNLRARLYKGWQGYYDGNISGGWLGPNTMNTWLKSKFSRNWKFNEIEESTEGAWTTQHYTWYTDNWRKNLFGWFNKTQWNDSDKIPDAEYRIEELIKIKKLSPSVSEQYINYGAKPASYLLGFAYNRSLAPSWLSTSYECNGYPKFVIIQDTVQVYEVGSNNPVFEKERVDAPSKGLGK